MIPRGPKSKAQTELRSLCATGKRRFRTEELAERALRFDAQLRAAGFDQRKEQRCYPCLKCTGWHLTSQPSPFPRQSDKRVSEQRQRSAMLKEVFGADPDCARCGMPADDAHEVLSRARGGSITDPANIVPLCRSCHDFVTTHPAQAAEEGWSRSA
jgi:5-methylcytosine-specific restriction endonuclease McrA